jgi:hypothetical protein
MDQTVQDYIDSVPGETRRRDAKTLVDLLGRITGQQPAIWGKSMIGFGQYHYKYASGREGDAAAIGFAPRKAATTIYLLDGVGAHSEQLSRLGPHTTGVGCLYVKDLAKVDLGVLEAIVGESYHTLTAGTYGHRAADNR